MTEQRDKTLSDPSHRTPADERVGEIEAPSPAPLRPVASGAETRQQFGADELAIVLSHYNLGVIRVITPFDRGSPESPKMFIRSARGEYLLKRRSDRRANPERLAFVYRVHAILMESRFPAPRLIATRDHHEPAVRMNGHAYELTEFVRGQPFERSPQATREAGRALAFFHAILAAHPECLPDGAPEKAGPGGYHASPELLMSSDRIIGAVRSAAPEVSPDAVNARVGDLIARYREAGERVEALGFGVWPPIIAHGDWHPGNVIFRLRRVAGVLDFDSARVEPRVADVSNGALQFSIRTQGDDPSAWPADLDHERFVAFCEGYDSYHTNFILSKVEIEAMPWLMIESLIAEALAPIAATGRFAGLHAMPFLEMVSRKAAWLADEASRLTESLGA